MGADFSDIAIERAIALLQHGIQFLLPLQTVPPYTASSATSRLTSLIAQLINN